MGGKDSKPCAAAERTQSKVDEVVETFPVKGSTSRAQPGAPPPWKSKRTQQVEAASRMGSNAGEFCPAERPAAKTLVTLDASLVDPSDPEWVQFLSKKYGQRRAERAPAPSPGPTSAQAPILLQTSEYFKLLKAGENKIQSGRKLHPQQSSLNYGNSIEKCPNVAGLKSDLAGAIDAVIRNHTNSKLPAVPRHHGEPGKHFSKCPEDKDDALKRIVQMFEASGQDQSKPWVGGKHRFLDPGSQPDGEERSAAARDDIDLERVNCDKDLAEVVYWSDDERAPFNLHLASAHKFRRLPRASAASVNEYVMQDLDSELDHRVATLLLHVKRIHERHISFKEFVSKRKISIVREQQKGFVIGVKEVIRNVRQGKTKCIVVAPDIEDSTAGGGLDERIREIMRAAYQQDIPVIYALSRSRIGRALGKSLRMSVLGVVDTTGVNDLFDSVLDLAYQKRVSWLERQQSLASAPQFKSIKGKGGRRQ